MSLGNKKDGSFAVFFVCLLTYTITGRCVPMEDFILSVAAQIAAMLLFELIKSNLDR